MTTSDHHISVCVCTFRRPVMLRRLLSALDAQRTADGFTFSVVVVDNDAAASARPVIEEYSRQSTLPVTYCVEPKQNIALARNRTIAEARGDWIAFIDDDEFPEPTWLQLLLETCERFHADGVLGPVRPHFATPPADWIVRGRFCERPEYPTGTVIGWDESRTGNVLFRRRILDGMAGPFDERFGTGGEDKDFFQRLAQAGRVFVWCNEAVVRETVPPDRCTRKYLLKRALLRGRNVLKLRVSRTKLLVKSVIAVPLYLIALPVLLLLGQHRFMKYFIKLCDHLGRLLAVVGLNPVHER